MNKLAEQPKDILVAKAKKWARKKFPGFDYEEICQIIDIGAWELENFELDKETCDWVRPAYVMRALQNDVINYITKEARYLSRNIFLYEEAIEEYSPQLPGPGEDIRMTRKTFKAAMMLFVLCPSKLSREVKDQCYAVYKNLTKAQHRTIYIAATRFTASSNAALDKMVRTYIPKES